MKKDLLFCGMAAALTLSLASCNSAGKVNDNAEAPTDSTGVIPCADCGGIETTLELRADGTYSLTEIYKDKKDGRFESSGKFQWDAANACITVGEGDDMISYIVEGDHLIMLDQDGHRVTGELADHYVLTKQAV